MWMRVDGALTAWPQERPLSELTGFFREHHILAAVQAQPEQTVDVRLLIDDETRVATSKRLKLVPGLELEDLLAEIERRFGCHAIVGDDDAPISPAEEAAAAQETELPIGPRAVTILSGASGQAAWLARHLGEPLVVLAADGADVVLTEEDDVLPEPSTWPECHVVQVRGADNAAEVFAGKDDHLVARAPWFAPVELTPGGLTGPTRDMRDDLAASALLTELPENTAQALDPATGSADVLFAALGLPAAVAQFAAGEVAAHEVPDVVVVTPPNMSETLKLMADDMIAEDLAPVIDRLDPAVDEFGRWIVATETDHPVAVRALSVAETLGGIALMMAGLRGRGSWRALGLVGGAGIAVSGISELVIYQLLRQRRTR